MADELEESGGLREVPASEILAKIEKGEPVEYDNVIIIGDLNPNRLNLKKDEDKNIITSRISITNSRIKGSVSFTKLIFEKEVNYTGSEFSENSDFSLSLLKARAIFINTKFNSDSDFSGTTFSRLPCFNRAMFYGKAYFMQTRFIGNPPGGGISRETDFYEIDSLAGADFREAIFYKRADFSKATFRHMADFSGAIFEGNTYFMKATFEGNAEFVKATFKRNAYFIETKFESPFSHAEYLKATFKWRADRKPKFVDPYLHGLETVNILAADGGFNDATFSGGVLTFASAKFKSPSFQEDACRRAKNILSQIGNKEEEGYHFYREMEAKRRQKPRYIRYPEFVFVQLIFGYGVHPWRLMAWWGATVVAFGLLYYVGNGLNGATQLFYDMKFSLATAIAPGYIASIISPGSTGYMLLPEYQAVAIIESIFGTFLWAGFIATFAKKYMK